MVYMGLLSIKGIIPIGTTIFPMIVVNGNVSQIENRGAYFGETALIEHEPQQDSAYAVGEVDLLLFFLGGGWNGRFWRRVTLPPYNGFHSGILGFFLR